MPFAGFDHLDVRVPSLAAVESFYDRLFPRLGLTRRSESYVDAMGEWHEPVDGRYNTVEWREERNDGAPPRFIGIIEDEGMTIVRTRFAFTAASRDEVDRWAQELPSLGAREVERWDFEDRYWTVFFTDPIGTRLEIVYRKPAPLP